MKGEKEGNERKCVEDQMKRGISESRDLGPLLNFLICKMERVLPTFWSECETQMRSHVPKNYVNFKVLYQCEGLWSFYKCKAESD